MLPFQNLMYTNMLAIYCIKILQFLAPQLIYNYYLQQTIYLLDVKILDIILNIRYIRHMKNIANEYSESIRNLQKFSQNGSR